MTWPAEDKYLYLDPWGASGEIMDAQYCCALCPTPNDGTFDWNPITEELICGSCDRALYHMFVWPASHAWLVELYPSVLLDVMARSGRSYRECRRIYLEYEAVSLTRDLLEDGGTEEIRLIMAPDGSSLTRSELLVRVIGLLATLRP